MNNNKPDYDVFVVTKDKGENGKRKYSKVGVAWNIFDKEGVSITLDPGTVLDWRMMGEFYINIIPKKGYDHKTRTEDTPP